VLIVLRNMLKIFLPLIVSFTLSTRLKSDSTRAARSPAPTARLSEEPGGCAGPRIERVDEAAATVPLEVFTTPGCAYCARAKRFFKRHSLPYTERDVSADEMILREMIQRASVSTCLPRPSYNHPQPTLSRCRNGMHPACNPMHRRRCPQIFVAGTLVGGYDMMLAEYEAGRLEPRLARAGLQMEEAAPEDPQPEVDEDEEEVALRTAALWADSVLNPAMGGGGAADAAGTAAALQLCMLTLMDEFLDDAGARVRYGALRASGEFAEFVMTAGDLCELPISSLDA
jgi:glutaredoxin